MADISRSQFLRAKVKGMLYNIKGKSPSDRYVIVRRDGKSPESIVETGPWAEIADKFRTSYFPKNNQAKIYFIETAEQHEAAPVAQG